MDDLIDAITEVVGKVELLEILYKYGIYPLLIGLGFLIFVSRKLFRFYRNLRKKILIITPDSPNDQQKMGFEVGLLRRSGFFRLVGPQCFRDVEWDKKYGLVVIGYKGEEVDRLRSVFEKVGGHIPVIIYTYGHNNALRDDEEKALLNENPLHVVSNFPLNLINTVFTTLAVHQYAKRESGH